MQNGKKKKEKSKSKKKKEKKKREKKKWKKVNEEEEKQENQTQTLDPEGRTPPFRRLVFSANLESTTAPTLNTSEKKTRGRGRHLGATAWSPPMCAGQ